LNNEVRALKQTADAARTCIAAWRKLMSAMLTL